MAEAKTVTVKLVLDTTQYEAALARVKASWDEFTEAARNLKPHLYRCECSFTEKCDDCQEGSKATDKPAELNEYGIPWHEATDPANEHAFVVRPLPMLDFAAKAVHDAQAEYFKAWPDMAGKPYLLWNVYRKDS